MGCRTCTSSMCGWSLRASLPPSGAASGRRTMFSWSKASWTSSLPRQSRIRSSTAGLCSTRRPRAKAVLDLAAAKAGWGQPLPQGAGRGVSLQFVFGTYMAQVAEVEVSQDGEVRVRRVVCAVDCGIVVNPDTVEAQVQGAIIFGITAALYGEITLNGGRVEQSNFDTYQILRIDETPVIEVHIVQSSQPPGGMGEPGTSAIAPAITNAIFAATGKRVRKLPLDTTAL